MQEILTELILSDPLYFASVVAAIFGTVVWYLYRGFITNNYQRIKWFRRLLLPHISLILRHADKHNNEIDLSKLYVQTETQSDEHVFDLYLDSETTLTGAIDDVGGFLIREKFRPEVILTSLAEHPEGYPEVGNFVLTAPEKNHDTLVGYGVFSEIFRMLTSKWQLHVRIYYDQDRHRLIFKAHKELNAYNPMYSKRHFNSKDEYKPKEGVEMFEQYAEEIEKYGIELDR